MPTVLMVEDNVSILEVVVELLGTVGYGTITAVSAEQAWAFLEIRRPDIDIVFSDIKMPGKSGYWLARQIQETYPDLPVVLTSGYPSGEDRDGVDVVVLDKPYPSANLLKTVFDRALGLP